MNGMPGDVIDGSGTINPAALNTAGMDFGCLFMASLSVSSWRPVARIAPDIERTTNQWLDCF